MKSKISWFKILLGILFFWFTVPYLIIKYTKNKKLKAGLVTGWVLLLLLSVGLNASPAKNQSTTVPKNVAGVNEKKITEDENVKKEALKQQEISHKKANETELQEVKQEAVKKVLDEKQKEEIARAEQTKKTNEEADNQQALENEQKDQEKENIQAEQEKNNISSKSNSSVSNNDCNPSYPTLCIPTNSPDLDCKDIPQKRFPVLQPDRHGLDRDKDGIGCEK